MKRIKQLMVAVAGMLIFSCTADDENKVISVIDEEGDAASMVLKLSNEVSGTRALDDLNPDRTQDILKVNGTVNVFFFTATGKLVNSDAAQVTEFTSPGPGKTYDYTTYGITTAVKEVVIVGNVGTLSGVISKATLEQKLNTLEDAQDDYDKSTPDIWVYGASNAINWDAYPAQNGLKQGSVSIDLAPVLSRIDVTVNTSGITDGYDYSDIPASNVDFKGVAVLYSGGYTHYTPSFIPTLSAITSAYGASAVPLRSGIMDTGYPLWDNGSNQTELLSPTNGNESILNATWTGQWNSLGNFDTSTEAFSRSFYAFPAKTDNGFYNRNTIVTVYGDFHSNPGELDDAVTPLFWAVHFSPTQALNAGAFSQILENGNVYNLIINLKGDYKEGGPGTVDPEEESNPADLEVIIRQVKWKAVIDMEIDFES